MEGTYTLDAQRVADYWLARAMTRLRSDAPERLSPDGRSPWSSWNEEQRQEAIRITEANVRWKWLEGFEQELRLEAGGRYTWITRERRAPQVDELAVSLWDEFPGEESPAPLPSPPPTEYTVVEKRSTGTWAFDGTTLTFGEEERDGEAIPSDKVRPRKWKLEDGAIQIDTGTAVLILRRVP